MTHLLIYFGAVALICVLVFCYIICSAKEGCDDKQYRFVFIHPAGLEYMRQASKTPVSFLINDEDLTNDAEAKRFAKSYPYWKVTTTCLTDSELDQVQENEWETCYTYFNIDFND